MTKYEQNVTKFKALGSVLVEFPFAKKFTNFCPLKLDSIRFYISPPRIHIYAKQAYVKRNIIEHIPLVGYLVHILFRIIEAFAC